MWASGSGGNSRSILMPDGNTLDFVPHPGTIAFEGQTSVKYIPEASFGERLYQVGTMYYLLVPGGERYTFESVIGADGATRFFPRNRRDSKGNFHTYTTDAAARITKVTDAVGNWIEITYAGVPLDRKQNVVIATITSAPVVGWNEINVTTSQPFQWVQGISAPGLTFSMSELEFYAPGINGGPPVKLNGTPYGNGPASSNSNHTFDKLFDQNTSTGFSFIRPSMGIAGLDLGTGNASHVAKIRYFISSYNANRLNSYIGHQFVGRISTPQIITTLTQVTSSHGDTVQYNYDSYTDPSIHQEHLVLKNIDYIKDTNGDGTDDLTADAEITWTTSLQGYAPHIERMIEPRKTGNNPDMAFEYLPISIAPAKGMPFRVKDGATGNSLFLMEHQSTRRYYFADGGIQTIANTAAYFLPGSSTDAEGNVTTYTWDQSHFLSSKTTAAGTTQYTHNYMGQPLTITHPNGLTESCTYDVQGRLLTKALSAPGYPTRTTTFTRNAQGKITKMTYPDGTFENYTYNALGLLVSVREKNGSFTVHAYDTTIGSPTAGLRLSTTRGLASATSTTGGETESFTWTGANEPYGVPARLLESATDERGRVTSYRYDAQGRLIQTTYPDNSFTQVNYDFFGNKVTEFNGTSVQYWTYDTFRRPLTHTDPNGGVTSYDYGLNGSSCTCYGAGAPTLITSPTGRKTRRLYDKNGRVTQETRAFGTASAATTLTTYDALGRTTSTTDPDGIVTSYTYDSVGNRTSSSTQLTGNSALTTSSTYTPFGETLTTTAHGNRTTSITYDAAGRTLTNTDPLGLINAVTYDAAGRTATQTRGHGTALAATTSYTYDLLDRVISVTHPGGATTSQTYHPGGAIHTRTNETGNTWTSNDALETWTDSAGNSWTTFAATTTDPLGKVSKSYSGPIAGGDHATRSVTAAGRITETIHIGLTSTQISGLVSATSGLAADPSVVVQTRNAEGETILTAVDPSGLNLRSAFTYDALGRQTTTTTGVGTAKTRTTTTAYNKRGLPISTTAPDGRITTRAYDALGRLLSETDPKNQTTSYSYWHDTSNILTITDARNSVTTFSYNARGQRIAKTFHGNTPGSSHTYDTLGRMATNTTANGHTETYTYDARDRQLTANWAAAGSLPAINVTRNYDAAGLLLSITQTGATSSTHTFTYNARGENLSETQVLFGKTLTFIRGYDDDGHLNSLTQPSGRVVTYSTSARGQINGVVSDGPPPLVSYTIDKAGRHTHAWHENGIIEHRQYDALSQLTAINIGTATQPTGIGVHTYTHDTAGRRTGHNNVNYTYDNADQVIGSTGAIARSYAYDAAGNRTSATQFGQTLSYTANALNQYTALTNSAAPTYDASGNTLTINGAAYAYDQKNQLKSVSGLDSNGAFVTVSYQYDSMGRRISSTVNNQTTLYAYDGWNVVEEYSTSNFQTFDLKTILTWGLDLSGSMQGAGGVGGLLFTEDLTTNTTWHHHYDGNGNVTHLTNASGQTVATYTYDAFGNTVTATGTAAAANKYRFSTKPIDETIATTPLYYYGYRYY
ncbi:MAG: RHS repeat protein, partial [Verrucomicrobia bacterium]